MEDAVSPTPQSWLRSQLTITNVVVILGFAWTASTQVSRIDALERRLEAAEQRERTAQAEFVRRDVATEQLGAINQRLARIEAALVPPHVVRRP